MANNQKLYIFTNENMPGVVKIGITDNIQRRLNELKTTGVPSNFECYFSTEVENAHQAEKEIHQKLKKYRVDERREFFKISPEKAEKVVKMYSIEGINKKRSKKNTKNRQRSGKNIITGGIVVLVVGVAIAMGVTLSSEPVTAGLPEGEITVNGDPITPYSDGPDHSIGLPAPSFSGPGIDSKIISVKNDGRAKAIVFLAHWCPHCQREVPIVQEYINVLGLPEGVDLIAVATSIDKGRENYPPTDWLQREGWSSPAIFDLNKEIAKAYGLTAFPYWVFIDKDFNILARRTGNIPQDLVGQLLNALAEN